MSPTHYTGCCMAVMSLNVPPGFETAAGYTPRLLLLPSSLIVYIKMSQKSIITVLFALVIGVLLIFSQQAEASKGPIITNKVC
jgi:hypothetical protein